MSLEQSRLGKSVRYDNPYDPGLLCPISRQLQRENMGMPKTLPFHGVDIWNIYELSWLNERGKPVVGIGEIRLSCETPNIIESKSLKLYFNSLNQTRFPSKEALVDIVSRDLSQAAGGLVEFTIIPLSAYPFDILASLPGECLDDLDIAVEAYQLNPHFLTLESQDQVSEALYSHLLKSNCLVTNQPDWATVCIRYQGNKIDRAGLLNYIISMRLHNEFHEPCVERIYMDILRQCQPEKLTVYARYTRRGGLDINPFRSNFEAKPLNSRLSRQ